jgi:hypothetical protein
MAACPDHKPALDCCLVCEKCHNGGFRNVNGPPQFVTAFSGSLADSDNQWPRKHEGTKKKRHQWPRKTRGDEEEWLEVLFSHAIAYSLR